METNQKKLLLTFLYLLCLYLASQFIPFEKISDSALLVSCLRMIVLFIVVGLALFESIRLGIKRIKPKKKMTVFYSLPLLLCCFSNFIYCCFSSLEISSIVVSEFLPSTVNVFLCCLIEELLFRKLLLSFFVYGLKRKHDYLAIVLSALCFSLMHIVNFTSGDYLGVLMQIGYTFVLGIILGILARRINDDILVILGHFSFNFFNMLLFSSLYPSYSYNIIYVVVSLVIAFAGISYALFLNFHLEEKENAA